MLISISKSDSLDPAHQRDFDTYNVQTLDELSFIISKKCWSPIVWKNGRRAKNNFLSCEIMALDFDDGITTIEDMRTWANHHNLHHIISTTKSHQIEKSGKPACDRFRAVLVFETVITDIFQYEMNMLRMIKNLYADQSCKDGGRYFAPSTLNRDPVSRGQEKVRVITYEKPKPRASVINSAWASAKLLPRDVEDTLRSGVASNRHDACRRMGIRLASCGYTIDDAVRIVADSQLGQSYDEPEDLRRTVADGWKWARKQG